MKHALCTALLAAVVALPASAAPPFSFVLMPSQSITADTESEVVHPNFRRTYILFNITNLGVGQTVRLVFQFQDPATGVWSNYASTTAETTTGPKVYNVGTAATSSAQINQVVNVGLPNRFRIQVDVSNGTDCTFSLSLIPGSIYDGRP